LCAKRNLHSARDLGLGLNRHCRCAVANVREERYVTKTVRKRPVKGLAAPETPENEGPAATPIQRMRRNT
jgi:hypothetical protein